MIGYHYTSYENWLKIKKEGLVPYRIDKKELAVYGFSLVRGIWIWREPQKGFAHTGCIIFQAATKNSDRIVVMRVSYSEDDCLQTEDKRIIKLCHHGTLNNMPYHDGSETARIVLKKIPRSDIELIELYDLKVAFKEYK